MSKHKSNVHPGYYKVAGRERQGEDIIHDRQRSMLTENRADLEHREPYPQWPAPVEKKPKQGSASTQAGELVLEELQRGSKSTRRKTPQESAKAGRKPTPKSARAAGKVLKGEGRKAASNRALARQKNVGRQK